MLLVAFFSVLNNAFISRETHKYSAGIEFGWNLHFTGLKSLFYFTGFSAYYICTVTVTFASVILWRNELLLHAGANTVQE